MSIRCTKAIPIPPAVLEALGAHPSAFVVWSALRAMIPPAKLGEWPTDATCRAGYRDLQAMTDPPLGLGAIRSGAARLVREGWIDKSREGPGTKMIWTLREPGAVLSAAQGGAPESRGSAHSSTGSAVESRGCAPESTGSALQSTPLPHRDKETVREEETDRDGRSSSSPPPAVPDPVLPPRAWVDDLSDADLMAMEHPDPGFGETWEQMDASERRTYLVDGEPPATWTLRVRDVQATWTREGGVTCGRYPCLAGETWAQALERAGGVDHRDDLIVALAEVAGEVAVMHPERHCLMVAGWVAAGERPRGRTRRKPPKVEQQYAELERQRDGESGRRAL